MNIQMRLPLLLAATGLNLSANAGSTICNIRGDGIAPKAISWDVESKKANIKDFFGRAHEGKLALVRSHGEGFKVNLIFEGSDKPFQERAEYIVFSTAVDEYRVLEVGYKNISGVMHLDVSKGNYEAQCVSL